MAHIHRPHHPHRFLRQWPRFHAPLVARFGRAVTALAAGTVLAGATLLVTQLEMDLKTALQVSALVDGATDAPAPDSGYPPHPFPRPVSHGVQEELAPPF